MIAAIVLAAGESSRMGRPKALLRSPGAGTSFVAHLIRTFSAAALDRVFVVGRAGQPAVAAEVARAGGAFVLNPDPGRGQLSSLLAGLGAAQAAGAAGVLVTPVDCPQISSETVRRLLAAAAGSRALIVRPTHGGRHGHPVFFRELVFDELRRADPSVGARAVVRADPGRVLAVEVADPGILVDVDTPDDYERLLSAHGPNAI